MRTPIGRYGGALAAVRPDDLAARAADIDHAMRLGAGHPLGPFERAEQLGGPAVVVARLAREGARGPRFVPAPALLAAAAG